MNGVRKTAGAFATVLVVWIACTFAGGVNVTLSPENAPSEQGMTKLLSVPFKEGRPKLSPEEEAAIHKETTGAAFRQAVRETAATLVVVGYIERAADSTENQQLAFRRAQLVIDVLRDQCGVGTNCQAVTFEVMKLPATERRGKQRLVEVWIANHP